MLYQIETHTEPSFRWMQCVRARFVVRPDAIARRDAGASADNDGVGSSPSSAALCARAGGGGGGPVN